MQCSVNYLFIHLSIHPLVERLSGLMAFTPNGEDFGHFEANG